MLCVSSDKEGLDLELWNVTLIEYIMHLFPKAESGAKQSFQRPHGTVGELISMTSSFLHWKDGTEVAENFKAWMCAKGELQDATIP